MHPSNTGIQSLFSRRDARTLRGWEFVFLRVPASLREVEFCIKTLAHRNLAIHTDCKCSKVQCNSFCEDYYVETAGESGHKLETAAREEGVSESRIVREALEERFTGHRAKGPPRAFDLVKDLCGSVKGHADLLTNPKYIADFGA